MTDLSRCGATCMPEVAAQLQLGFDSVLNPRVDDVPGPCFVESAPTDRDEPIESDGG